MANDIVYHMEVEPMSVEVDGSAIIGDTSSYTNEIPEINGETNFSRELNLPYAQVEDGIAVLYQNEWYMCVPKK